ncbi:MAG: CHASE3 domain-containing protein [Cyclobacteriaceae bacterium]|nr:CHASE3 domain-containing protein [Cyclobacteriaceae bacterium]
MTQIYIEPNLRWWFLSIVCAILVLIIYSYSSIQRFIDTGTKQDHTRQVVNISQHILSSITELESAQRAYIITANEEYLQPYQVAILNLDSLVRTLFRLVQDNAVQEVRVSQLKRIINKKQEWVGKVIETRKESFLQAQALVATGIGIELMNQIRDRIAIIQQEEDKLYLQRGNLGKQTLLRFQGSFAGLLVVTAVFVTILFFQINKNMKARLLVEQQLQTASAEIHDLYNYAPCGYLSVDATTTIITVNQTLLDWLGYQAHEVAGKMKYTDLLSEQSRNEFRTRFKHEIDQYQVKGYVSGLEFDFMRKDKSIFPVLVNASAIFDNTGKFMRSRTTVFDNTARKNAENKAEQLRKEMEAFTYSVSHDLRAPLRFIGGYAQMLQEDYNEKLDAEGSRIINTIQKNAERMGQLIDDLLDFSRLGRKELMMGKVNLDDLVSEVLEEFQVLPHVEITRNALGMVHADISMIKQVWINLISNALKYSRKQPVSRIEIGRLNAENEIHFYVQDNGVGFDMNYAHKLFEVFQRLHKVQEFEGTGVGLALVKRIVTRHGGRVWAASRPGQGAVFYFSLPNIESYA